MPQAWAPSPLTSPPRQSRPLQPLERGGRILQDEGQVPLFTGADAQQLAAMEQRAPLLYGSPDRHPHTESSSIPHDAIQAEVARQLDGLKQQLRAEQERAGRAEAELLRIRSQQAGEVEATALQPVGTREVGFSRFGDSGWVRFTSCRQHWGWICPFFILTASSSSASFRSRASGLSWFVLRAPWFRCAVFQPCTAREFSRTHRS